MSRRSTRQKLALFREAFRGRPDIHGTRNVTSGKMSCVRKPPTNRLFLDHLGGQQPLGIYPLVHDRLWFAAIDLDESDPEPVLAITELARGIEWPPLVEPSKTRGWHLWWFADEAGLPAWRVRRLLMWMTAEVGRPATEVFPKQDALEPKRFGNFIFLPLDGRLVPQARTIFVEPKRWLPPVKDPWDTLDGRVRINEARLTEVMTSIGLDITPPNEPEASREVDAVDVDSLLAEDRNRIINIYKSIDPTQNLIQGSGVHTRAGLPLCARRMLAQGVTSYQRVICFRLAVHLHRLGFPSDLARVILRAWARKNKPSDGKRVITHQEIDEQTDCAYTGRYRGYGCDDPRIACYCADDCPLRRGGNGDLCNTDRHTHAK